MVELTTGSGDRIEPPIRHDYCLPDCAVGGGVGTCVNNAALADPIGADTESNEYTLWLKKFGGNVILVGPTPAAMR